MWHRMQKLHLEGEVALFSQRPAGQRLESLQPNQSEQELSLVVMEEVGSVVEAVGSVVEEVGSMVLLACSFGGANTFTSS